MTGRLCHGDQLRLSQRLGVSTRTLRNWRAQGSSSGPARRDLGRPSSPRQPWSVLRWTVKTWRGLVGGHDGWRTLLLEAQRAGLALSTRWLQQIVAELKRRDAARARSRVEQNRQHVEVHAKNAIWADDELFLGRDEEGEMRGRVVRDGMCPEVLAFSVGPPAEAEDMVAIWEVTRAVRGCLPLVMSLDNGRAGRSLLVRAYLARHQVIALYNEPHVPQHNALVEREIGDLRRAVDAGRELWGALSGLPREQRTTWLLAHWGRMAWHLNAMVPRPSLGGMTPYELDRLAPSAEDRTSRARFYHDCTDALARVASANLPPRARRRAEREAVYRTLEAHGLVTRTRGANRPSWPSKRKRIT